MTFEIIPISHKNFCPFGSRGRVDSSFLLIIFCLERYLRDILGICNGTFIIRIVSGLLEKKKMWKILV